MIQIDKDVFAAVKVKLFHSYLKQFLKTEIDNVFDFYLTLRVLVVTIEKT